MGEQKERMLRGEPYLADDPELIAERSRARRLLTRFNTAAPEDDAGGRTILEELLGHLGAEAEILPPFRCDYGSRITIGDRTFVNYGAILLDAAEIRIGSDCQIGPAVQLLTSLHPLDPDERRTRAESARAISIGDGAWLGAGVIVLPGVSVGPDSVVGAGSVVTRDLPERVLAVGNPCRVVRPL